MTTLEIDVGYNRGRDSQLLYRQMEQLKGVTKCLSMSLLLLSIAYFITRLYNFAELKEFKENASKTLHFWQDLST